MSAVAKEAGGLFKTFATGAAVGGAGFVATALATLWATPIVARELGLERYGVLGLLMGLQGALLMFFSNSGQMAALVLLAGRADERLERRSRAYAAWSLLAAGGVLAAAWLVALPPLAERLWGHGPLAELWRSAVPWAGLGWACQLLLQALWTAQRARLRVRQAEGLQALISLAVVLSAPWVLLRGGGFVQMVETQALVWVLGLVVGVALEKRFGHDLRLLPRDDRAVFAEFRRLAGWSALALAGGAVLLYADRLYSLRSGARELAAWSVATALSLRVASGLGLLGPLLLPTLSSVRDDAKRWIRLQSLYLRLNALAGLAFFVPLAAGGAALLGAWVAPEVEQRARSWIVLLSIGGLGFVLNQAYLTVLMGMDGARAGAQSAVGAALLGLLAGGWAQAAGLPGAAWMAALGQGVALLWRAHVLQRYGLGRRAWAHVPEGAVWLLAAAVLVALLRWLNFPLCFGTRFGLVLFCFGCGVLCLGALFLFVDVGLSRVLGRESLLAQIRRLRPAA
jgi:O-antigen/teichoic acid export membrane protein